MREFIDDVNGVIIGGDHRCAQLYYQDRPQGQKVSGYSDQELKKMCMEKLSEIKSECGSVFTEIYPEKSWTIRFYD